ncbi:YlxQ family RNA-binding protein [Tepidibacillus fermentans]|uniref:LSU ribosomal protein L7AE n=1 Tax=Tepidibacillus fermentans TaxID=1281767 RepID=A0A4V2USW2_9BACI|nr:YlxQ family RNA-binding protein [Tepidibacillus fermentans]TCS82983.1 LSU ribosomal protein L7AE [Tepidibacillus fermentans]
MNKFDKILSFLGLAAKARKIITGEELVVNAIQEQKVFFVLLSTDASENIKKKILNKCEYYQIPYRIQFSREQLGHAIGKTSRVVIGITDFGFSKKLQELTE